MADEKELFVEKGGENKTETPMTYSFSFILILLLSERTEFDLSLFRLRRWS